MDFLRVIGNQSQRAYSHIGGKLLEGSVAPGTRLGLQAVKLYLKKYHYQFLGDFFLPHPPIFYEHKGKGMGSVNKLRYFLPPLAQAGREFLGG